MSSTFFPNPNKILVKFPAETLKTENMVINHLNRACWELNLWNFKILYLFKNLQCSFINFIAGFINLKRQMHFIKRNISNLRLAQNISEMLSKQ